MSEDLKNKRQFFKYNEDDILEILTEYLAIENNFDTFSARAILIGEPNKDLRLISVVGELEDFNVKNIDLEEVDKKMEFNGSH